MERNASFILPILALVPGIANAHLVSSRFGEFYSGLLHPLTTLIHLVPWLALAMFEAVQGKAFFRRVLIAFPALVALGIVASQVLPEIAWFETKNMLSFLLVGGLVALALKLPAAVGLVGLVGLTHGHANAATELAGASLMLYVLGVATAAYLVPALGAGAAVTLCEGLRGDQSPSARSEAGFWQLV